MMTMDAYLTSWGATVMGRTANDTWSQEMTVSHKLELELQAVFLAVKHFLLYLEGQHV